MKLVLVLILVLNVGNVSAFAGLVEVIDVKLCERTFQRLPLPGHADNIAAPECILALSKDPIPGSTAANLHKLIKNGGEDFSYHYQLPPRQGEEDYDLIIRVAEDRHRLILRFGKKEYSLETEFENYFIYQDVAHDVADVARILKLRARSVELVE